MHWCVGVEVDSKNLLYCVCISPHRVVQHCSHTETYAKNDWQVEEGEEEPRQLVCCGQLTPPLGWDGGTRVGTEVV